MWDMVEWKQLMGGARKMGERKLRIFCKHCEYLMHYKLHKCIYVYESDLNEILSNQGDRSPTGNLLLTNEVSSTGIALHIIELLN